MPAVVAIALRNAASATAQTTAAVAAQTGDAAAAPASAAPAPVDAGRKTQALTTVTVTADQQQANLQKAPLAITALSSESLGQSNISDMSRLKVYVPGMNIAKSSGYERIVTIRGIGSETPENACATQPGVSFHVDGVYIANIIWLDQSLFDVDQRRRNRRCRRKAACMGRG